MQLFRRYEGFRGWLRSFFTAMNAFAPIADRNVTNGSQEKEWMPWIYGYCRSHPQDTIVNAALELAKALSGSNDKNGK